MRNAVELERDKPAGVLAEHHRDLDRRLASLVAQARENDPIELRAEWSRFERELLRHMEIEETTIVPTFSRRHPLQAADIVADHVAIRSLLLEMGVDLDLHLLRAASVDRLVEMLRSHARREDAVFYRWAQQHVAPEAWRSLERGLANPESVGHALPSRDDGTG